MKENNQILIGTNEDILKDLNEAQRKMFYEYKSKLTNADEELALTVKEDKQIMRLEKTYDVLKTVVKYEAIGALIAIIFVSIFNFGFKSNSNVTYSPVASEVIEIDEDLA